MPAAGYEMPRRPRGDGRDGRGAGSDHLQRWRRLRGFARVNTVHLTNVDTAMIQREDLYRLFRPDLENPTAADFEEASHVMHLLPVSWVGWRT